ncbi:MAG: prephenate dehydratase [bacterium]
MLLTNFQKFRKQINSFDLQIMELLNKRMEIVKEINKIKKKNKMDYYDPKREKEIVNSLIKLNKGFLPNNTLKNIYQEIFFAARSLDEQINIAYWGPEGTFTHMAAIKQFGINSNFVSMKSIKNVFESVAQEYVKFGVVPIENSTEGIINYTLDMFVDIDLKIWAEIKLEIHQHLLSKFEKSDIKRIYSQPYAIAQTREWIEKNFNNSQIIEVATTAVATKIASEEEGSAAIGSELASKIYKLNIVSKNIEDNPNNATRFLIISKEFNKNKTKNNKTSIMVLIKDKVGALYEMLKLFADNNINLTKIESRPSKLKQWEYYFFIDFCGYYKEKKIKKVLEELKKNCLLLKILGSYSIL